MIIHYSNRILGQFVIRIMWFWYYNHTCWVSMASATIASIHIPSPCTLTEIQLGSITAWSKITWFWRPLHACLASVNQIPCACCPNTGYCYEARDMHSHILLQQYSHLQQCDEKTNGRGHKDACAQISRGNTKWLLHYKCVNQTCFSSKNAYFHREHWFRETPL